MKKNGESNISFNSVFWPNNYLNWYWESNQNNFLYCIIFYHFQRITIHFPFFTLSILSLCHFCSSSKVLLVSSLSSFSPSIHLSFYHQTLTLKLLLIFLHFDINMTRPFELVKDINDSKELWKIVVRIHHKWIVVSKNKEHFQMIVVDKEVCFLKQSSPLGVKG